MSTQRRLVRLAVILVSALLLLVVAAILTLRSAWFHGYALRAIVQHAQEATGGRVEIGDFTFHRAGLRIDFYRVVLHGTEPAGAPLLAADHIGAGLRVISWLGREVKLNDVEIDHPVVHLSVDAQGHSNLPQPPASSGGQPTDIFQLAVRYAGINAGEIYYNDQEIPLDAQTRDLKAGVRFDPARTAYQGSLSYQNAIIHFGALNPLTHNLETQFSAAPSGLQISSLKIQSGTSWITAQARMSNYASPTVEGSYQAGLSGAELGRVLKDSSLPRGTLDAKGTLNFRNQAGVPVIKALESAGTFSSRAMTVETPQARAEVRDVAGQYRLSQGNLEVASFKAATLGGSVNGKFTMAHLDTTPAATLAAEIHDLALQDARRALRSAPPQADMITGRLNASLAATWRGSLEDLKLHSDATVTGSTSGLPATNSAQAGMPQAGIPLNATIHAAYEGRQQVLTLTDTSVHTPHSTVNVDGSLGERARLMVNAQSNDLHEIDVLVLMLRSAGTPTTPAARPQLLGLAGAATFSGTVQGSVSAPQINGKLTASNLQYSGADVRKLEGSVSLSPSGAAIRQGTLQDASGGSAQFDLSAGLHDWSYSPQSPINVQLSAQKFQIADLERMAHLHYPVAGTLSASLTASGSQANPSGHGSVTIVQARAWDQPVQNLTVNFQGTGQSIHSTVSLNTTAGSATVTLTYNPKQQSYDLQAQAPSINLGKLAALGSRNTEIAGTISVTASGRGTLKDPQLKASVQASKLHAGEQDLSGLKAEAAIANQQAQVTVASVVSGAELQAKGTVNLTGDHQAHMTVESQTIELGPLLATLAPQAPGDLKGETQVHASLDGPLSDPDRVSAQVEIPSLSLGYQSFQISSAGPIRLEYRAGTLTLQQAELKGTDSDLRLQGSVPIKAPGAIQVTATGQVDMHLVKLLDPQIQSSGRINLDVSARGTRAAPEVTGTVRLANVSLIPVGAPLGIDEVNGEIDLGGGRLSIKSLTGQCGGGTLTARGFATYSPSAQVNLGVTLKDARLLYQGVRSQTDAELNLTGTPAAAIINGQVIIDQLSLTRSFDLANFANQLSGSTTVAGPSLAQNVKLNVSVVSREQMSLANTQLSVQGSANLQVRGTLAEPVILGRTDITSGEVFFQGKRFQVQNGVIQFVNPVETEPVVNLAVTTTVQQFNLTVNFLGPIDRLRTTYTSDPPLAPVDIINLLVSGRTTEAAQQSPSTPQSLLAQGLSSEVSNRVQKLVGISSLTIDPQIGGNQGNAGTQLAIQQRVTKNLFFTFATDVRTTQGEVVQVEYQISRRYSVSAVRDQTGGYQVQVKAHKTF